MKESILFGIVIGMSSVSLAGLLATALAQYVRGKQLQTAYEQPERPNASP
uniref:Cytochrome b6/f complex subunit V n=2 Tax=Colpodellida TaxID=877183 RepID=D9IXL3_9ALVE|nr:cytochrome b6/f complex subunit V [Chromerida sp. RM11]ADJ66580.1 cytochrome b6/f complex subunit V [Chromerida sp. RM11]